MSSWELIGSGVDAGTMDKGAIKETGAPGGGDTTQTEGVSVEEDEGSPIRR